MRAPRLGLWTLFATALLGACSLTPIQMPLADGGHNAGADAGVIADHGATWGDSAGRTKDKQKDVGQPSPAPDLGAERTGGDAGSDAVADRGGTEKGPGDGLLPKADGARPDGGTAKKLDSK